MLAASPGLAARAAAIVSASPLPSAPTVRTPAATARVHGPLDDAQGWFAGMLLVALGVSLLAAGRLVTGGTVGLAMLLHYLTGADIGWALLAVNLPFAALSWRVLGARFTLRSAAAVGLLAAVTSAMPRWIAIDRIAPGYAALAGGLAIGVGLLILLRHRTSLGGFNAVALWAHRRYGASVGLVQFALDGLVLAASLVTLPSNTVALSLLAAAVLNLTLAVNHRPGRYVSF
jgi:uncharacterized membrane-anchored protein YitT (DUF2179 family)